MTFELQHTDSYSEARTGLITTDHGQIKTPIFMPVGTAGSVKGVHFAELREQVKAQIILGNTYHLFISSTPGTVRYLLIQVASRSFRLQESESCVRKGASSEATSTARSMSSRRRM